MTRFSKLIRQREYNHQTKYSLSRLLDPPNNSFPIITCSSGFHLCGFIAINPVINNLKETVVLKLSRSRILYYKCKTRKEKSRGKKKGKNSLFRALICN